MEYLIGLVIGFMLGLILSIWLFTGIKDDARKLQRECRYVLDLATSRLNEAKNLVSKAGEST